MEANHLNLSSVVANKTRPGPNTVAPGLNTKAAPPAPADEKASDVAPAAQTSSAGALSSSQPAVSVEQDLVQEALRKLNDLPQTSIAFSQHEETGRSVITVSDKETGEEIRTIPSEDLLEIAAHLEATLDSQESLKPGSLVSSTA